MTEAHPSGYQPPPAIAPPPVGWRPATLVPAAPPRELPSQDHDAIDESELFAGRLTAALGALAAAVLVVMLAVLCGQLLR